MNEFRFAITAQDLLAPLTMVKTGYDRGLLNPLESWLPKPAKVQKADPGARRKAMIVALILLLILAGLSAIVRAGPLDGETMAELIIRYPSLLPMAGAVVIAPVCLFAIFVYRKGSRVSIEQRYPLPGEKTIKDTVVREGPQAVTLGRQFRLLAVLLLLCSLTIPWLLWRLAGTLITS